MTPAPGSLDALDGARRQAVVKARGRRGGALGVTALALCGAALVLLTAADARFVLAAVLALPCLIGAWTWQRAPMRAYRREAAAAIYPLAAARASPGLGYAPMGGIDPRTLEAAGLLPPHDRAEYTHHVKGPYRGVGAEFCAAHLTRRETRTTTDSRGRLRTETRTVTVFRGVYARFSLPRPLPARVYLRRDGGFLEGVFGGGPKGCERVRVEDPEFERRFTLFSDDQVGARVLFTTTFMARVLRAAEIAQNGRLAATFEGDEILVRIPRPDLSLGLGEIRGPGDAERETTRLAAAFARLLSVADTLGLTDQPASPS